VGLLTNGRKSRGLLTIDRPTKDRPTCTKPALLEKIQLYGYFRAGLVRRATYNRRDEQMMLSDEPGPDRVCGQRRTTHRNVVMRLSRPVANRLRVGYPIETGSSA
jgi:hypothetical protein